jgi:hypothetical protein
MNPTQLRPGLYDLLLILLVALTMLAIIIGRAPYLHDYAEWLYQAQIVKNFAVDPASVSAFTMATYPVPNSLVTALLAGLSFVLPPLWAGKIFLILMLLAWCGVIRLFTRRFVETHWCATTTLVLFCCFALATFFWYGFMSYQLALILLTWFFATYREDTSSPVIAVFGMAIFFSHAMVFLVYGLFLGVCLLLKWNRRIVIGLLPATAFSMWFLAGRHIAEVEAQRIGATWNGLQEALTYKTGYPAMLGPFKNFILTDGSSLLENHPWLYWLGFSINFAVAAALGILVFSVLWNHLQNHQSDSREAPVLRTSWAISMLLIIGFYLFSPYHFFGLVNAGGRVLIPLLLMALMLGGSMARPFIRFLIWPVVLFTYITCGSYFYLMNQTRQPDFSPKMMPTEKHLPSGSVFEFNQKLNASTRYKYFNYRLFAFSRRFEQIESQQYQGLTFRQAMLIKYESEGQKDKP